jgi:hypothetical protein
VGRTTYQECRFEPRGNGRMADARAAPVIGPWRGTDVAPVSTGCDDWPWADAKGPIHPDTDPLETRHPRLEMVAATGGAIALHRPGGVGSSRSP